MRFLREVRRWLQGKDPPVEVGEREAREHARPLASGVLVMCVPEREQAWHRAQPRYDHGEGAA